MAQRWDCCRRNGSLASRRTKSYRLHGESKSTTILTQEHNPPTAPRPDTTPNKPAIKLGKNAPAPGTPGYSLAYIETIWKMEMEAALARLHRRLEAERRKLTRQYWVRFWPVFAGLVVASIAPELKEMLNLLFWPWGMGLVFPFVVLCGRPELHLGSHLAAALPQFMLYAEYPLEGFFAKCIIKGKVRPLAVIGRIACLHLLAGALLLLVSGAIR